MKRSSLFNASDRLNDSERIVFNDLQAQRRRLGERIDRAINRVLAHGRFILGPEVRELENQLAESCGAKHAIGCSSGTDALLLGLIALGVRPGEAVFVPSFTFAATAEAVALIGAVPVFVDVRADSFNMDPESLEAAIAVVETEGALRPVGVIAVDLFGQPADYPALESSAERHGLWLMADAAQSFGAALHGRKVGTMGRIATISFYPAKPLGCYGDGGAIFTADDGVAELLRSLRVHGKGLDKYDNIRIGINGRLDTLQAAILIEMLGIFEEEIALRQEVAENYNRGLRDIVTVPRLIDGARSVWAQYTVVIDDRDGVAARLRELGVPTAIYYPRPLHRQTAYRHFPAAPGGLPVSEDLARRVLSLPFHPYLDADTQERIVTAVRRAVGG